MRSFCWSIAGVLLLSLVAVAQAETVAYWRFEEAEAGACAEKGFVTLDSSGNGNHIDPFDGGCMAAGFRYLAGVAWDEVPQTGEENALCWRTAGTWPSSSTDSAVTNPAGIDAEAITPQAWTVEATIKAEDYLHPDSGNEPYRCYVGRDSYGMWTANASEASFYLQVGPANAPAVRFVDVSGFRHAAFGAAELVQEFDAATDPDGASVPWYHLAAVSDGSTLSLWMAEEGQPYVLVAQTDMTASGSPDTSLSAGEGERPTWGHVWHDGAWTVGRGLWDSWHQDRGRGLIDEVRISNEALPVHKLLGYHRLAAWDPTPADGAVEVSPEVTFEWQAVADPANASAVHPQLAMHRLYMQKTATDPNWGAPIDVPVTGLTGSYGPVSIGTDLVGFRWAVEEVYADDPTDPNVVMGPAWSFDTIPSIPVIESQPSPRHQVVQAGGEATIAIVVESLTTAHYAWMQVNPGGEDVAVGTDEAVLTIANVTEDAHYYCVVTNDGGSVESDQASVAVSRQVAHWAIDATTPGEFADLSGEGHAATVAGAPTFVAGFDGAASGAVDVTPASGWATAGTWDPSEYSGQLTVSFWLYWDGPSGWQTFVAKRDGGFTSAEALWQVSTNFNQDDLWFEAPGYRVWYDNILEPSAWQHIVATFDGTTGRLFFNGEQVATSAMSFGGAVDTVITLGADSGNLVPAQDFTNGSLDDVQLYNYALSELAVARLYNDMTGESVCVQGAKPEVAFDFNGDCIVDLKDIALLGENWLICGLLPDCVE